MAQTALAFDTAPALGLATLPARAGQALRPARPAVTVTEPACPFEAAVAIGRDHARHGLVPPAEHLLPGHPVRQGWEAARGRFGQRTLPARRSVRLWLQLRLQAWQRGQSFEDVQVTPNFLAQIDSPRCPVTRQALVAEGAETDGVPVRVFEGAGHAAGNLAMLSQRAATAKAGLRWDEARLRSVMAEASTTGLVDGLSSVQWARLASLMSLVTPLPHELAASLPLLVLPPNRLRLLNPIQGLQALVTLQLTRPGYAARMARLVSCLPGTELRRDFQLFFHSLLPRVFDTGHTQDSAELRQRLEDAWRQPLVLRRWQRFATALSLSQTEAVLQRAVALGLGGQRIETHTEHSATEGWSLATTGRLPAPQDSAEARPHRLHALTAATARRANTGCHTV